ncbi:histone-like protein [Candidatus Hodarchaeum mangrovi]
MSFNQKNSEENFTGFSEVEIKKLLRRTGIPRISKESIDTLNKLCSGRAKQIAAKAVQIALENERDEIIADDITQAVGLSSPLITFESSPEDPLVHYVWFLSSGGTCLLRRSYSGLEFPDTIFAGLLTGILDLMSEVTGRLIEKFSTDDLIIHIRRIGDITVAVICDSDRDEPIDELTDLLAVRFKEVFSEEIQESVIDTSVFDEFTPVLDALVSSAGLKIPQQMSKVRREGAALSDRQIEETIDAAALREAMRRAKTQIQDFAIFKKDEDKTTIPVEGLLDEPPDVREIKAVLKQASQDLRTELNTESNGSEAKEVLRNEVMKELTSDFPEAFQKQTVLKKKIPSVPPKSIKSKPKKVKKRKSRRKK